MTKEDDLTARLAAVLQDLQRVGAKDLQVMLLLGSLASDLSDNFRAPSWSRAKLNMKPEERNYMLTRFQVEGREHQGAKREKHAYVIQALAVSLAASTQPDRSALKDGERLLDQLIDRAVDVYRLQRKPN
jgi:hypothetical protein